MSNNEWVQEGTPRDAEWTEETDDYGVPVEPAEWDDYSAEQAVPVPAPPAPVEREDEPTFSSDDQFVGDEQEFVNDEPEFVADEPGYVADEPVTDHASVTTAPDPDDIVAGGDEPVSTVELGETPEEVAEHTGATEASVVHDEELAADSVFADDRPVGSADDDVAREVEEGIETERTEHTYDDEPLVDDTPRDDDLIVDESFEDQPVREDGYDESYEGGATRVDADDLERRDDVAVADDERAVDHDPEAAVFERAHADDDIEATAVAAAPLAAAAGTSAAGLAAPAGMAGLYRTDGDETQVLDTTRRSVEDEAAEEEARAAALRAERQERERRLGMVQTSDANAERELRPRRKGVGPFGSFGLFVLRLITAAILGILAYQVLYSIDATADFLTRQPLIPEPRLVAWILGFTLAAMAVMLVIGLGVRIVGLVLAAIAIAALVLVRWGSFSPFVEGMEGFLGDKDLLMAGVGILFLSLGGGRFGVDGAISRSREEARETRRN